MLGGCTWSPFSPDKDKDKADAGGADAAAELEHCTLKVGACNNSCYKAGAGSGCRNCCREMGKLVTAAKATASIRAQMLSDARKTSPMIGFALGLLVLACTSREQEKPTRKRASADGGVVQRPECGEPANACHYDCYVRQASPACTRCCMDQDRVCDDGGKADFDSCKGSR